MKPTLHNSLPQILAHLKDLLAANITPHAAPPEVLQDFGLMDEGGKITTKGRAFLVRLYPLADVLDMPVA